MGDKERLGLLLEAVVAGMAASIEIATKNGLPGALFFVVLADPASTEAGYGGNIERGHVIPILEQAIAKLKDGQN